MLTITINSQADVATLLRPGEPTTFPQDATHLITVPFSQLENFQKSLVGEQKWFLAVVDDHGKWLCATECDAPKTAFTALNLGGVKPMETREPRDVCITPRQIDEFKRQVLAHLLTIDQDTWSVFRQYDAVMEDRWVTADGPDLDATPEMLVDSTTVTSTFPLAEILRLPGARESVGSIDGQPIFFLSRSGVYAWAAIEHGETIEFWLSWPAYPRGWD